MSSGGKVGVCLPPGVGLSHDDAMRLLAAFQQTHNKAEQLATELANKQRDASEQKSSYEAQLKVHRDAITQLTAERDAAEERRVAATEALARGHAEFGVARAAWRNAHEKACQAASQRLKEREAAMKARDAAMAERDVALGLRDAAVTARLAALQQVANWQAAYGAEAHLREQREAEIEALEAKMSALKKQMRAVSELGLGYTVLGKRN